jgi:Zn-dependent protease with chaperone function
MNCGNSLIEKQRKTKMFELNDWQAFGWIFGGYFLRLSETLLHFLWQGCLIAMLYAASARCMQSASAGTRYMLGMACLLLMAACLPATFWMLPAPEAATAAASFPSLDTPPLAAPAANYSPVRSPEETGPVAISRTPALAAKRPAPARSAIAPESPSNDGPQWESLSLAAKTALVRSSPYIIAAYFFGVGLMLLRVALGLWGGRTLRGAIVPCEDAAILRMAADLARRMSLGIAPAIAYSRRVSAPLVVGVLRPMILFPVGLMAGLTMRQTEAVLLHELAHIRRFDPALNVLQRLIEAVLFFHPAVWWISRQVGIERENACDDMALMRNLERVQYADALLRVAEICAEYRASAAYRQSALAATGKNAGQLRRRILRLLVPDEKPSLRLTTAGVALAILPILLFLLAPVAWQCAAWARENAKTEQKEPPVPPSRPVESQLEDMLSGYYDETSAQNPPLESPIPSKKDRPETGKPESSALNAAAPEEPHGKSSVSSRPENSGDALKDEVSPKPAPSKELSDLIEKVRQNEALYQNFEYLLRSVNNRVIHPGEQYPGPTGTSEYSSRTVFAENRVYHTGDVPQALASGKTIHKKWISVYDGSQTVTIEEGNSAAVHRGRFEHYGCYPPHTFSLAKLRINFPLSDYLQGAAAMNANPKVRQMPLRFGPGPSAAKLAPEDINRVEAAVVGEETVGGLECVKVRLKSWYDSPFPPDIHYLWLAKERNYHIAQWEAALLRDKEEIPDAKGRVTKWLELEKGIWFPGALEETSMIRIWKYAGPGSTQAQGEDHTELIVKKATLNPKLPPDFFKLPKIPASLPKFETDRDGRFVDSPHHPEVVKAEQKITLEEILRRMAEEEKRYDRYEIVAKRRYGNGAGASGDNESRIRSVVAGNRFLEEIEEHSASFGKKYVNRTKSAYDGQWTRSRHHNASVPSSPTDPGFFGLIYIGPKSFGLLRPHTLMMLESEECLSLSDYLSPKPQDSRDKKTVDLEYVGDERIDGLYCYKLKRSAGNYFCYIWLARDRNMLPLRREEHRPELNAQLPDHLDYAGDLREIRPGLWVPYRATALHFIGEDIGLCENRLVVSYRREVAVEKFNADPKCDDKLFTQIDCPKGASISVKDERDAYLGKFDQPANGNIDIAPDELASMRERAAKSNAESERRRREFQQQRKK